MNRNLVKVGRLGRAHGLKGELKIKVESHFFEDVIELDNLLIQIGGQPIPYFVNAWRSEGGIVKLEEVDSKEAAALLQYKDVFVSEQYISSLPNTSIQETPFDKYTNWIIEDETVGMIGMIVNIVDLPQHYLAEVMYNDKWVMIPLHEDLIHKIDEDQQKIVMNLPEGLLEL